MGAVWRPCFFEVTSMRARIAVLAVPVLALVFSGPGCSHHQYGPVPGTTNVAALDQMAAKDADAVKESLEAGKTKERTRYRRVQRGRGLGDRDRPQPSGVRP